MKAHLSLFIVFTIIVSVHAVNGQNTFNKLIYLDFPSTNFTGVIATDSCYYVKGTFSDTITPARIGIMLAKLNLDGDIEFVKTIKHPDRLYGDDYCNLLMGKDSFIYEVGLVGDSISRAILIKYSNQGDTLLTKEYKSILYPALDYFISRTILQKEDGGFAILFGHESIPLSDFDISMLLLDSAYNIQQYKVYGSTPQQETANSLILDSDGGYIIGASRENTNQVWENYTSRCFLIKTDSMGNVVWQWLSPQGQLWGEAEALFKTSDGGLVVASRRGHEVNFPVANVSLLFWDANVFKLDANRNLVWSTPLRGHESNPSNRITEMVEALDGSGYVLTGQVVDSLQGPEPMLGTWLAKVSPDGDSLWARHFTWHEDELWAPWPWSLAATPDGGYVAVGISLNVGQIAPGWILKVDSFGCLVPGCHLPNAVVEEGKPTVKLSIYPNPTADFLNFHVKGHPPAGNASARIVNEAGQVMKQVQKISPDETVILPVANWPSGVYFLQYLSEGQTIISEKFIKI
jgi:hypothetical protein